MALEHAIMTSLAERPGTGYEIGQQFTRSIGHFWSATHQQIYRTLKKLHTDGLVSFESVAQDGRPDKKVYTLSAKGRVALREWVSSPTEPQQLRDELGVKIRAAEFGNLPGLIAELKRHRDLHEGRLRLYQEFEKNDYPDPDALNFRKLKQYLVLRGGVRIEIGFIEWCDEVIGALSAQLDEPPSN
ncbi:MULTISPECIES: PadR family transcriptional regulator [Actinomycetes]|uniref:PadR family transcriptional regulator n=1 Tax=Williamsia marianensis TaxID=85044 RepID=A0A315SB80_WILMA|nr:MULTISPECIES: PadR family transcriptional regulator [Actinomycetes]PVY32990.1 PadR family transcriptional regulator [Williamsia marianensis]RKR95923.1 PadR family transcriptional regulator [Williamsia muralis]